MTTGSTLEIQMYLDYPLAEIESMVLWGGYPPEDIEYHRECARHWAAKLEEMRQKLESIIN